VYPRSCCVPHRRCLECPAPQPGSMRGRNTAEWSRCEAGLSIGTVPTAAIQEESNIRIGDDAGPVGGCGAAAGCGDVSRGCRFNHYTDIHACILLITSNTYTLHTLICAGHWIGK